MKNPGVIITGASSGIGRAFAEVFAARSFDPILIARDGDRLRALVDELEQSFGVQGRYYRCDLTNRQARAGLIEELQANHDDVRVLVNNAGAGNLGEFQRTDLGDEERIVELNISALVHLAKAAIPMLKGKEGAAILNVASAVGHYPLPFQAVYSASKAFVISFSRSLRAELKGEGISVSVLCPGNVRTPFLEEAGLSNLYQGKIPHETTAEAVAEQGYDQLMAGKAVIFPDKKVKSMIRSFRLFSLSESWMEKATLHQYTRRKEALHSPTGEG